MSILDDLKNNADNIVEIVENFKVYCETGERLVIPEGVESIGGGVFSRENLSGYSTYLTEVVFPSTLKSINCRAFGWNSHIKEININHGCEYLYSKAFIGCYGVESLYLPNTIKTCYGQCIIPTSNMTNFEVEEGFAGDLGPNLDFSNANFSAEVMVNVFNNLKDLTGESSKTLVFGSTNLAKLTAEQIAIATDKNWNLS